jgi:hypothetical protein
VSGPLFQFSDTWQLVINTGTTVLTFLAVFLIQHSQNRDGRAIQLKLDELIRSTKDARNRLIDLEHCSDEEMERLQKEFSREQTRGAAPPKRTRSNRPPRPLLPLITSSAGRNSRVRGALPSQAASYPTERSAQDTNAAAAKLCQKSY